MINATGSTSGASAAAASGSGLGITAAGGDMGKEEFLQLLVAQLRHQDPMNPMQSQDFAVQLAQFSTVEQLIEMNDQIAGQTDYSAALAEAMNSNAAVGALGHEVLAVGDAVTVSGGTAAVTADIGEVGGLGTLRIYGADGNLKTEVDLGKVEGGRQTLALDELEGLPDGVYRYELDVQTPDGKEVSTTSYVAGTVSGVKYGMAGPVLVIGAMEIPLGAVVEISAN